MWATLQRHHAACAPRPQAVDACARQVSDLASAIRLLGAGTSLARGSAMRKRRITRRAFLVGSGGLMATVAACRANSAHDPAIDGAGPSDGGAADFGGDGASLGDASGDGATAAGNGVPAVYPLMLVSPRQAGSAPAQAAGAPAFPTGHPMLHAHPG